MKLTLPVSDEFGRLELGPSFFFLAGFRRVPRDRRRSEHGFRFDGLFEA